MLILGLGPLAANFLWPFLESAFKTGDKVDYQSLFLIPAGAGLAAAVLLLLFFHPPKTVIQDVPELQEEGERDAPTVP